MGLIENVKNFFVGKTDKTMSTGETANIFMTPSMPSNNNPIYPDNYDDNFPYSPVQKSDINPRFNNEFWLRNRNRQHGIDITDLNNRVKKLEDNGVIKNLYVITSEEFSAQASPVLDASYNFKNELETLSETLGADVLPICICGFDTINVENNNNSLGIAIPFGWFLHGQIAHVHFVNNFQMGMSVAVNCFIQILVKEV